MFNMDPKETNAQPCIQKSIDFADLDKRWNEIKLPDEIIGAAFRGTVKDHHGNVMGGTNVHYLIITDKRVIFSMQGVIAGNSSASFNYPDIGSVESSKGFLMADLFLNVRGAKERFANMGKVEVDIAVKTIRENIQKNKGEAPKPPAIDLSIHEQIEKLADLHRKGILTDAEFTSKKQELLKRI